MLVGVRSLIAGPVLVARADCERGRGDDCVEGEKPAGARPRGQSPAADLAAPNNRPPVSVTSNHSAGSVLPAAIRP